MTLGLMAATMALAAAFVFAPAAFAGGGYVRFDDNTALSSAFAEQLVSYWNSVVAQPSPQLIELIDLWRRWHAIKVVITVALVAILSTLAARLWRRYMRHTGAGRLIAALAATVLAMGVLVILAVNIQSTAAPLSALLPLLPVDPPPGELRDVMAEIHAGLLGGPAGPAWPMLSLFVTSQRHYLWALGAAAVVIALVLGAAAVAWRRSTTGPDGPERGRRTGVGVTAGLTVCALMALVWAGAVLAAAAHPETDLLTVFTVT